MYSLDGQVALVTGSGSRRGIGRAAAFALAEQGAAVVCGDLSGAEETAAALTEQGAKALGVVLDVTDEQSVAAAVQAAVSRFGGVDILVNNAGISHKVTVEEMAMEDMRRIFEVNLFGLFRCTKAVLPLMKAAGYGRIINMASVAGKRGGGVFGGAHYSASKAAVLGFSKNLAREVAGYGVTVNCVAPGLTDTDIWSSLSKEEGDALVSAIPAGRPGTTAEVAAAIAFLASREAAYITGEEIDINGGSHMD